MFRTKNWCKKVYLKVKINILSLKIGQIGVLLCYYCVIWIKFWWSSLSLLILPRFLNDKINK